MWNKNLLWRVLGGAGLVPGIFSVFIFWGCEGSATQTTNTGLHGILVDTDGRPVPGAKVKAWPTAASPNGILNNPENVLEISTETDSLGHYSIPRLDVGIYNIYGDNGNGQTTIFIPRVRYVDEEIFIGKDTLLPPGAITGKVVAEGRGLAMVFCYVQGSSYLVMTDTSGLFTLKGIPTGTYTLNYHSRGYLTAVDSPITVVSGATTALMPKSMVRYMALGPASPTILASEYDTLTGRLFLAWNRVRDEKVASYTLEYFPIGHPELAVSSRITGLTDTVLESYFPRNFFVQVYRPGEDPVPLNFFKLEYLYGKEAELTMEFRILSVDSLGNISQYKGNPTRNTRVSRH